MVSAPAPSADTIGVIFRAPKTWLHGFELVECVKAISGTLFFDHFFDFCSFEIRLLWWCLLQHWDADIPHNSLVSRLGSPFPGGDMPRGNCVGKEAIP